MKYDTSSIHALVLAGGINRILLYDGYQPGYKGLLLFAGKPLIQHTLEALSQTPEVRRICIVGPVTKLLPVISEPSRYEYVEGGTTLIQNIIKGLDHFSHSSIVLIIPSDLPLVTAGTISRFLHFCSRTELSSGAAIYWSVVPESSFTGPYANVRKGFNRFRDVSLCHGNLLLLTPSLVQNPRFVSRMNRIYNRRKSTLRAALAVGPIVGFSYLVGVQLLRVLTLSQFARIAAATFGVGLIPIIMDNPDIAVDIDEARDYQFILEELVRRERHPV